jgi:hypothetical protein
MSLIFLVSLAGLIPTLEKGCKGGFERQGNDYDQ